MKVSDLSGRDLDYWVARAEGYEFIDIPPDARGENACRVLAPPGILKSGWQPAPLGKYGHMLKPWSSSWEHGGPIIERKRIVIDLGLDDWFASIKRLGVFYYDEGEFGQHGVTPLIAAMRAYVTSKFGDEVEEPK
jgi:hypothetical protein